MKKVVFIEPYPKSYAEQLHGDAILVGKSETPDKVVFEPFIGVAPFRYRDIFERGRRKDDSGQLQDWIDGTQPKVIVRYTVATYLENETAVTDLFYKTAKDKISEKRIEIPGL